jgi:hypothetical protein
MGGSTAKSQILAVSKIKNSGMTGFSSDSEKNFIGKSGILRFWA